jgi:hypothetical protein
MAVSKTNASSDRIARVEHHESPRSSRKHSPATLAAQSETRLAATAGGEGLCRDRQRCPSSWLSRGQASVVYGGAEFSRDTDIVVVADDANRGSGLLAAAEAATPKNLGFLGRRLSGKRPRMAFFTES